MRNRAADQVDKQKVGLKQIAFIQMAVFVYSFCGVFQKFASREETLSLLFLVFYGCSFAVLFIYAILWQLVLKKMDLSVAYSNRAVAMIWSLLWGVLFFGETLKWNQVIGALVICYGVHKVVTANDE